MVVLAQDEARDLRHPHIGTEHLLLGLLREEEGLAARVLASFGVTAEDVRAEVGRMVGPGNEVVTGMIPFTPRAKKVLELSLREALAMKHGYIGTEHILLGLLREGEGVAVRILAERGGDPDVIRNEVVRILSGAREARREPPGRVPWEYEVRTLAELAVDELDEIGLEGWELVALTPEPGGGYTAVFKRPRR